MKVKANLNPQVSSLLHTINEKMTELNHPPLDVLTPEQSREFYSVAREFFPTMSVNGIGIEDTFIPSIKGHDIPIRIYTPSGHGPFPVMVYSHGGGWVFGDLESADNICRYVSRYAGIIVVSIGYRLAPEHKYPSAFQDVIEAIKWTFRNLEKLKGDNTRIGVGGESSGGNLAAASAIYFRDFEEYNLTFQVFITPVLDYYFDTLSYRANYRYNLTNEKMKWFWNHYLNSPDEGKEIFVSPLKVPSTKHLPRTLIYEC
ncbi:alpha/beta hydrolase [Bacillus sp. BHET2]|uniref:alpha/beta hydrolase n=1 Tax=Bacillus sp. BHET2 TaxID=2583818 RepID=UPI00110E0E64|nr:alpha/beta hydrolase [Bacillus sp. BHET2]TMU84419.1 alpha/beta hydrolase [Bacillus sp. BHET2]